MHWYVRFDNQRAKLFTLVQKVPSLKSFFHVSIVLEDIKMKSRQQFSDQIE